MNVFAGVDEFFAGFGSTSSATGWKIPEGDRWRSLGVAEGCCGRAPALRPSGQNPFPEASGLLFLRAAPKWERRPVCQSTGSVAGATFGRALLLPPSSSPSLPPPLLSLSLSLSLSSSSSSSLPPPLPLSLSLSLSSSLPLFSPPPSLPSLSARAQPSAGLRAWPAALFPALAFFLLQGFCASPPALSRPPPPQR
jgi:hypothetical protein